jgi:hypothetical protein
MRIQTFLTEIEHEAIKTKSIQYFGRENISGYVSILIRQSLNTPTTKEETPVKQPDFLNRPKKKPTTKKQLTSSQIKAMTDSNKKTFTKLEPIPAANQPETTTKKKLTPKDLQIIANNTKEKHF